MPVSRNSTPRFDPYGDASPTESSTTWSAPTPGGPLEARLTLPGSKSITNRELVLSALADGTSLLRAPLHSRDTDLMVEALRSFGTSVEAVPGAGSFGSDLRITPADELVGSTTIDVGLAGTVMRFTPPIAALALGPTTFDGDEGARRRPMATTIRALRALGVDVADDGAAALPFTVHGSGRVAGGSLEIDASASSQFVSGLLLSAPRFDDGLRLTHSGSRLPSQPHIDMTVSALRARGVEVRTPEPGRWEVDAGPIAARTVDIEPDLSNAAPFLAAALVLGGSVRIDDWPSETTQVGDDLIELLPLFGAEVERDGRSVTVRGSGVVTAVSLDLETGGELAPTLVALAALADGPSEITGIGHIRHHETDRLAALVAEITNLGGEAEELPDGIRIVPRPLHGGVWHSYEDHRMATAGALLGLAVAGIEIDDIATTSKTLPEFPELWLDLARSTR